jgi:hypothetical protein
MARGGDESLVRELYLDRAAAGEPPRAVRVAYTDYLIGRHRALEAYALWLDNLDPEQTAAVGYLNDGEFNHAPSGEGFGWRFGEGGGFGWRFGEGEGFGWRFGEDEGFGEGKGYKANCSEQQPKDLTISTPNTHVTYP